MSLIFCSCLYQTHNGIATSLPIHQICPKNDFFGFNQTRIVIKSSKLAFNLRLTCIAYCQWETEKGGKECQEIIFL
jgi:hypothetical protein